jgi:hypothetical protein
MKYFLVIITYLLCQNIKADSSYEQKIEILEKELEQTKDDIKSLTEQKNVNFKKIDEIEDDRKYSAILYEKNHKLREQQEISDRRAKAELENKLANTIARHDNKTEKEIENEKEKLRISRMKSEKESFDKHDDLKQEREKIENSRMKLENDSLKKHVRRADEYIDKDLKK